MVYLEPIALYHTRDLHGEKDGGWMRHYPAPGASIALGEVGVQGAGSDLAIVTYANGNYLSHQALPEIEAAGIKTRIIDLRWLSPLPVESMVAAVKGCKHVLIVDETRHSGGVAEALMSALHEAGVAKMARVTSQDSFIATGPAYAATMPSAQSIAMAAKSLVKS